MENPLTWTPLELAINDAIIEYTADVHCGIIGYSQARIIADKIREGQMADLIREIAMNNCDDSRREICTSCRAADLVERLKL